MKKEVIEVPRLSAILARTGVPLSAAIRANGFVFVSGLPPIDLATGEVPLADIRTQTRMSLEAVKAALEAAGTSLAKVVKTTVYITNSAYFETVNEIYREYFGTDAPARTFVTVGSWPWKFDIEIECMAIA